MMDPGDVMTTAHGVVVEMMVPRDVGMMMDLDVVMTMADSGVAWATTDRGVEMTAAAKKLTTGEAKLVLNPAVETGMAHAEETETVHAEETGTVHAEETGMVHADHPGDSTTKAGLITRVPGGAPATLVVPLVVSVVWSVVRPLAMAIASSAEAASGAMARVAAEAGVIALAEAVTEMSADRPEGMTGAEAMTGVVVVSVATIPGTGAATDRLLGAMIGVTTGAKQPPPRPRKKPVATTMEIGRLSAGVKNAIVIGIQFPLPFDRFTIAYF